jgi:hypothetical protein
MKTQENFNDLKSNLSPDDIEQVLMIVAHRCRANTWRRLRSILTYGTSSMDSFGIYSRLIKENGKWQYIAGQSYPDEIRTLRECMLGKIY